MWTGAGEGFQLPITSTNCAAIFRIHWTRSWSLLLAKKFPLPASVPHRTALHTSHNSAPEYKPVCLTLPASHFYHAPHPPVLSSSFQGLSRRDDKVSAPSSPRRSPLPARMPIWDPTSGGTLVFYHMSGARNNSLEGAFPPPHSCKQRNSLFLE